MIYGLLDDSMREKSLTENHNKLQDAIEVCLSVEHAQNRNKEITNGKVLQVQAVKKHKTGPSRPSFNRFKNKN